MEELNFFRGINHKIDKYIEGLSSQHKEKQRFQKIKPQNITLNKHECRQLLLMQTQAKQLPVIFSQSKQGEKKITNRKRNKIDITKSNKNELLEILKSLMIQYINCDKKFKMIQNSCDRLKILIKDIYKNDLIVKTIKEKIIIFGNLLSIPIVNNKKNIHFSQQIHYGIIPYYNREQHSFLENIYSANKHILYLSEDELSENEYLLYSILKSIKYFCPDLIHPQYKTLTFHNMYNLYNTYQSIVNLIVEKFPEVTIVIKEVGLRTKLTPKFKRYIFINNNPNTKKRIYLLKSIYHKEENEYTTYHVINKKITDYVQLQRDQIID